MTLQTSAAGDLGSVATAREAWFDLDGLVAVPTVACQRRVYFYSNLPPDPERFPQGIFIRKPFSNSILSLLCAGARQLSEEHPQPIPCAVPGWLMNFHVLELRHLCHRMVTELPACMGFRCCSLYLYDSSRLMLTLAETNSQRAVDLTIRADLNPLHLLAHVAHTGRTLQGDALVALLKSGAMEPAGADADEFEQAIAAPLTADGVVRGVILLQGRCEDAVVTAAPELAAITRFLGRCLLHACEFESARTEARIDGLTGLFNYRWMIESLAREIRRSHRFGQSLSIVMLDLDGFKAINDRYGHLAGDAVLKHVAGRIRSVLRQVDAAARIGGDEFLVMLPETDTAGADHVADRIRAAIRDNEPVLAGDPVSIGLSMGVATWQPDWDAYCLLEAADQSMYAVKREGRSRFVLRESLADPARIDDPLAPFVRG